MQILLRLDDSSMADLMHLETEKFQRLRKTRTDPSVTAAMNLSKALNIGFEPMMMDQIDYVTLAHQFVGRDSYLPQKYRVGASSRRRTLIPILNTIEQWFGWERRAQVLRNFQMTERMLENPDDLINLRLSVDIAQMMLHYHRKEELLIDMGKNAVSANRHTPMGHELSKARNLRELFEKMFNSVAEQFVERNFKWTIRSLDTQSVVIRGVPDADLVGTLGKEYMHSHAGCLIRQGFISSIPAYLGYPSAEISKKACVSSGDGYCEFQVNLQPLVRTGRSMRPRKHQNLALC